jgi:hypothetical protein
LIRIVVAIALLTLLVAVISGGHLSLTPGARALGAELPTISSTEIPHGSGTTADPSLPSQAINPGTGLPYWFGPGAKPMTPELHRGASEVNQDVPCPNGEECAPTP